jgi:hypothetical protein
MRLLDTTKSLSNTGVDLVGAKPAVLTDRAQQRDCPGAVAAEEKFSPPHFDQTEPGDEHRLDERSVPIATTAREADDRDAPRPPPRSAQLLIERHQECRRFVGPRMVRMRVETQRQGVRCGRSHGQTVRARLMPRWPPTKLRARATRLGHAGRANQERCERPEQFHLTRRSPPV